MQATFTTNMKCQSCLSKVAPKLDEEPRIKSWDADLSDPRKVLRVQLADKSDAARVIERVAEAGFTASQVDDHPIVEDVAKEPRFKLSTYKPLLLVVAYVVGLTLFIESLYGDFAWHRAMRHFMGFFFLGFAFFKLLNVSGFADAFSTYDVIAKRSRMYALSYPWIELALGTLYLSGMMLLATNIVTALVMSLGLVGVVSAVRKKQAIQCACLGTVFNLPMSVVTIIENSVMIAMAVTMILLDFVA
jgi:cation transport ATPase